MKKQINPTIKAYLIRSAFYLLLLLAVCAIPFALAQRSFNGRGTPTGCTDYNTTTGTGTITPGDTDTGNHCDDCATAVSLPFPSSVYGQTYNSINVASNGSLDLVGT